MNVLYIACNPKPEEESASLTIARELLDTWRERDGALQIQKLDLYAQDIPEADMQLFEGRALLIGGTQYAALDDAARARIDRADELCGQFISADRVVIAAPMWSLSFPARLKNYLDCIIQDGRTVRVTPERVRGLLNNKPRRALLIQACGGNFNSFFASRVNYGAQYLKNIFLFLGFEDFLRLGIDGTGLPSIGYHLAVARARARIISTLEEFNA